MDIYSSTRRFAARTSIWVAKNTLTWAVEASDSASLFLYDEKTQELWSYVAEGIEQQVIRIPSGQGIAGSKVLRPASMCATGTPRLNPAIAPPSALEVSP